MERKSSTEYSVVFLGKQKVQVSFKDFIFVVGSVLRTGSAQRLSSQNFAAVPISNIAEPVPSGFFSVHNHGFCGGPNTFSEKHRSRVNRNKQSNLRNSRNIESSRNTSLEFPGFGNGSDNKHGRVSAFRCFLSITVVFAADRSHFPKKNTRVYVNPAAINKQLFKY